MSGYTIEETQTASLMARRFAEATDESLYIAHQRSHIQEDRHENCF
jgi:hypothetical protein